MVVRMAILRPLTNTISGFVPTLPLTNAAGGGMHSGLTRVGEFGPEIVNLPRGSNITPNHKLGGDTYVNVTNNTSAEATVRETSRGNDRMIEVMIENVVADSIANGGAVSQAMGSSYGSQRRAVQR